MVRMRDEARSSGKLSVKMGAPEVVSGRRVQRFDLAFPGGLVGVDASALTVWFDLDASLVLHTVMLDAAGRMVEDYDWRDIRLDTGLTDDDFRI